MRICLLLYRGNPYSGGQGIYLKYVAEELVRQGHEVHAIVGPPYPLSMEGVFVHKIPNNQYYVRKGLSFIEPERPFEIFSPINFYEFFHSRLGAFPEISSFGYRAYLLLRKLHRKYRYDIIHDNQSLGYGLLLMKSLGVPVVATIHHPLTIDMENGIERCPTFVKKMKTVMFYPVLMQGFVSRRLDHVITVSEDSRRAVNRAFGGDLDNFDPAIEFFQKLAENDPIVPKQTSYARVVSGEIPILFDYDFNAYRAKYTEDGNFEFVIPCEGTVVVPYVMSLVADAPNPELGKRVLDFIMSDEGQAIWTNAYLKPARPVDLPEDVAARFLPDSEYARATPVDYAKMERVQAGFGERYLSEVR